LALLENVRSKAIGVGSRGSLGFGENVNLAMCLFERLRHFVRCEELPPGEYIGHWRPERMPDGNASRLGQHQGTTRYINNSVTIECANRSGGVVLKRPEESSGDGGHHRMVEIPLPPVIHTPRSTLERCELE